MKYIAFPGEQNIVVANRTISLTRLHYQYVTGDFAICNLQVVPHISYRQEAMNLHPTLNKISQRYSANLINKTVLI